MYNLFAVQKYAIINDMKNTTFVSILVIAAFIIGYLIFLVKEKEKNPIINDQEPALVMGNFDPNSTEFNPVPRQKYFGGRCYNEQKNEVPC